MIHHSFFKISFLLFIIGCCAVTPIKASSSKILADEICDNGIDDDNDGLIDLNDPDCDCSVVTYSQLMPNPSFEERSCCPFREGQMECLDDWSQASPATTDYMNHCDWVDDNFFTPPLPFPDGDGCLRFINGQRSSADIPTAYKEYAGVCLDYPMKKDSIYLIDFYLGFIDKVESPDINITVFGTANCGNLPFTNGVDFDCPIYHSDWEVLSTKRVVNNVRNGWQKVQISIIPTRDIEAITVGPDCDIIDEKGLDYYFLDDFRLNKLEAFDFELLKTVSPCHPDFTFAVQQNSLLSYQWYKEGIAIIGETSATLSEMQGEGLYQLRIIKDNSCRVKHYIHSIPVDRDTVFQLICEGIALSFGDQLLTETGVYIDTLASITGCDSIVIMNALVVNAIEIDTIHQEIISGTSLEWNNNSFDSEGFYTVSFLSENGCDSTIVLDLKLKDIFIPNAFSPNFDGINDVFKVYASRDKIKNVNMSIYDRWGGLLFRGKEWDGIVDGKWLPPDVFVYLIRVTTDSGEELMYSGEVTLVK
jgi:gliding motility-associated-like protein